MHSPAAPGPPLLSSPPPKRHEKLMYDEEGDTAMASLASRFSSMTGLGGWLNRTKTL